MRLILVRHYKTLINASNQIMGWGDAPRVGNWEKDLAYVDKTLRDRGIHIDEVHSSYLERARRTAMYYAKGRGIHLIRDSEQLNEINYGPTLYKKSKAWVARHFPLHKKDPDFVYPDGESFRQMQARSVQCVNAMEGSRKEKCVLLVVHAGVIRGLICHFLGLSYAPNLARKICHRYLGDFHIENGVAVSYDELGKPSGFVNDGVINTPWNREQPSPVFTEEKYARPVAGGPKRERGRPVTGK